MHEKAISCFQVALLHSTSLDWIVKGVNVFRANARMPIRVNKGESKCEMQKIVFVSVDVVRARHFDSTLRSKKGRLMVCGKSQLGL